MGFAGKAPGHEHQIVSLISRGLHAKGERPRPVHRGLAPVYEALVLPSVDVAVAVCIAHGAAHIVPYGQRVHPALRTKIHGPGANIESSGIDVL